MDSLHPRLQEVASNSIDPNGILDLSLLALQLRELIPVQRLESGAIGTFVVVFS